MPRKGITSRNWRWQCKTQDLTPKLVMVYHVCFKFGGLGDTQLQKISPVGPLLHTFIACSNIWNFEFSKVINVIQKDFSLLKGSFLGLDHFYLTLEIIISSPYIVSSPSFFLLKMLPEENEWFLSAWGLMIEFGGDFCLGGMSKDV